jgi:hypothetical protein
VLQYHSGDNYATSATLAKGTEYGVRGIPAIYFNGANPILGAGSEASAYSAQTAKINAELAKAPQVAVTATMSTLGGIKVNVNLANTGSAAVTGAKLYVVLYEDIGTAEHHYVVRDIVTPLNISSVAVGGSQQLTASSSYAGSTAKLNAVVFVRASNGEVLQAALAAK